MPDLAEALVRRIRQTGPMTIADYMVECLTHPDHGYYSSRDPLGAKGDFTTAPEISQMFGELIGLCLAQAWIDQGRPARAILCELGPGRGTLMADALRATRGVPGFHAAVSVHLVEVSRALRAAQHAALGAHEPDWHDRIEEVPDGPLLLVANEFFDALPVRQFIRSGDGWAERVVGEADGRLAFGLTPGAPLASLTDRLDGTAEGDLVETRPAAAAIAGEIGRRIAASGGAALIVDYGDWRPVGDTFQAVRAHERVDPLDRPGQSDLTAHVDFAPIAAAAAGAGAAATRLTPQGVFLERLGITARAQSLAASLSGTERASHVAAHRRLTHPEEMGDLFKVIGIHPKNHPPPAGLDP